MSPVRFRWSVAIQAASATFVMAVVSVSAEPPSVREVMERITVPESSAIFDVVDVPADAGQWRAIASHSQKLAQTSEALMAPGQARDNGEWAAQVKAHIDAASSISAAVEKRDFDALLQASDALATTCVECHKRYLGK